MEIEDKLYKYLHLYKKSPSAIRSLVGRVYNHLPTRIKYGKEYELFTKLLKESKCMSDSMIRSFQLEQLNKQVLLCKKNVPYYNKILANIKLPLKNIEDFKLQVPFTTKEEIRIKSHLFVNQEIPKNQIITTSTGGTTGEPLKLYLQKGVNRTKELVHMNDQWGRIDYKPNDLRMVFRSYLVRNAKTQNRYWFDPIKNRIFVSSFHLSVEDVKLYVDLINKYKPSFLHVYPSVLNIVCNVIEHNNIKIKHYPKGILCGSENTFPDQIKLFRKVFKSKLFRWYGLTEEASLAGSCEYTYNYHPFFTYSFTELTDKHGMEISKIGDRGEIVGTPFFNYVMPILRYKTQDFAVYGGASCEQCNRPGPIFREIEGREQENIYDTDGYKYSLGPFIFGIHETFWSNFTAIQFVQSKKGEIRIISQSCNLDEKEQVNYLNKKLAPKFENKFILNYSPNGEIQRTNAGKHKFLINNL